jgi:hypothetical protein
VPWRAAGRRARRAALRGRRSARFRCVSRPVLLLRPNAAPTRTRGT